jgi:hypothetical protein
MTIAGHELFRSRQDPFHALEVLVTSQPDPFWDDVRRHVTSWAIICGIGGVGYLAVSVPIRLDKVLSNQEAMQTDIQHAQDRLTTLEQKAIIQERQRLLR